MWGCVNLMVIVLFEPQRRREKHERKSLRSPRLCGFIYLIVMLIAQSGALERL